jgi:hypothetical protein
MLEMKRTSNGRRPQNIKQNIKCLKWRQPLMEDDLKILKVEYLSNHLSDPTQILNSSSGDQKKVKNAWNEDDLEWKTTSKY